MFGKCLENIWRFVLIICVIPLTNAYQITNSSDQQNFTEDKLMKSQTSFESHGVHKAICTVTVGDVTATAEAKAITPLTNDKAATNISLIAELKHQIVNLQNVLQYELAQMKKLLKANPCACDMVDTNSIGTYYKDDLPSNRIFKQLPLSLKSGVSSEKYLKKKVPSANNENGAIKAESDSLFYMYRWKLNEFAKYLHNNGSAEVESDEFSIAGRVMKIKIYFRYLQREYLFIQLIESTFNNRNNRITLDITSDVAAGRVSGTVFKEISDNYNESNQFKYTISIIKQNTLQQTNLVSQFFHTYECGFSVPISALVGSPFVYDDSLLIQIYFYI